MRNLLTTSAFALALLSGASPLCAAAPQGLSTLIGSWSGSGTIKLENGQSEKVRCKAYYTERAADVGVAVRCASAASKIDLRALLSASGSKISGTWEERQFNAAGSLTGSTIGNRLSIDMDGGGLKASVVVATTGASQTFAIKAESGGFKSVTIALARD